MQEAEPPLRLRRGGVVCERHCRLIEVERGVREQPLGTRRQAARLRRRPRSRPVYCRARTAGHARPIGSKRQRLPRAGLRSCAVWAPSRRTHRRFDRGHAR